MKGYMGEMRQPRTGKRSLVGEDIARRTRLAFLNAEAALESLPTVIDLMGEELEWSHTRDERRSGPRHQ
jgi:glycerol-3-phosphate dehydrogenase